MTDYADLELGLHRRDAGEYAVEFRYSHPQSDADIRLGQAQPALAHLDLDALRALSLNPASYGAALTAGLFGDPAVQTAFAQACASAASLGAPLRLRLLVGPSASELHSLRWETLQNPLDGSPLTTSENIFFSRYLSSLDWRPVRLRPRGSLRALVAVAGPADLADYALDPVDVPAEFARARAGLGGLAITTLPAPGGLPHCTLNDLAACLRDGEHDILYLACHGLLRKDGPWLFLEDELGKTARVMGDDLVLRLKELSQRPRLVVLASCESAGASAGGALAALGPRLAEAGVPAVIAMQGEVSVDTLARFMPAFFTELQRDGQIDRAVAVARGEVRGEPDYWAPALFMRLRSGRIWYVPGFGEDRHSFEKWPALARSIKRGQCTPILGPGLVEPLLGSPREIAQRWAETYHYPMAPHERESLPQVAQFLTVQQDRFFPIDELDEYLKGILQARYAADLPPELRAGAPGVSLDALIDAAGAASCKHNPLEPHRALAQLPLPIYITTNTDNLLACALQEAGKDPQVVLCPWNEYLEQVESVYDTDPNYQPSPERPLVYHLFGRLNEPESLVVTEDHYFDYLIGVTGNKELVPAAVRRALADTALLFLGFQLDDWNFRVIFRSLLSQQGGGRRDRYAHIAAQIEPEEGRLLEPERALRYLESYFSKGADISLYWGSAEEFLGELLARIAA